MRVEATDPHRELALTQCTSTGRYCQGRWLGPADVCERAARRAVIEVPCPDGEDVVWPVHDLVRRLAAAAPDTRVVVAGRVATAEACWAAWNREAPTPTYDVLDYAGESGRCAACAWVCEVCRAKGTADPDAECRALDTRCCLAEEHTARCIPTRVRWLSEQGRVKRWTAGIHDRLDAPPRPPPERPAYEMPTRRAKRRRLRAVARQRRLDTRRSPG